MLDAEVGAVRETAGADAYRAARALELHDGEARLAALRSKAVELGTAIAAGASPAGRRSVPATWTTRRSHLRHAVRAGASGRDPIAVAWPRPGPP